jgi:hypothetical protein
MMIQNEILKSPSMGLSSTNPFLKGGLARLISMVTHVQKKSIESQRNTQKKVVELNKKIIRYRNKLFDSIRMENYLKNFLLLLQKQSQPATM